MECFTKPKLNEANFIAIKALGRIFLRQKDNKKASVKFEELTKLNPHDSEVWSLLGESQYKLRKFEEAMNSYLKST